MQQQLGRRRCCLRPRRRSYRGPSRIQRGDRPRLLVASYETFRVERVQSRPGVWLHVRVPRELEVALKPPLRKNMVIVLNVRRTCGVQREKHASAVLRCISSTKYAGGMENYHSTA